MKNTTMLVSAMALSAFSAFMVGKVWAAADANPPNPEHYINKQECKLNVKPETEEKQLEPDDLVVYSLTITPENSCCEVQDVVAKLAFTGKHEGLTLNPATLNFGNISHNKSVTRKVRVNSQKVTPGKFPLSLDLDFKCVYVFAHHFNQEFPIEVVED